MPCPRQSSLSTAGDAGSGGPGLPARRAAMRESAPCAPPPVTAAPPLVAGIVGVGAAAGAQADAGVRGRRAKSGFSPANSMPMTASSLSGHRPGDPAHRSTPCSALATGVGPERRAVRCRPCAGVEHIPRTRDRAQRNFVCRPGRQDRARHRDGWRPARFAGRDLVADLAKAGRRRRALPTERHTATSNTHPRPRILATTRVAGAGEAGGVPARSAMRDGRFRLYVTDDGCVSDPTRPRWLSTALRDTGEHAAADRAPAHLRADGGPMVGSAVALARHHPTAIRPAFRRWRSRAVRRGMGRCCARCSGTPALARNLVVTQTNPCACGRL